jgi:tetratricopeptide (TPR) repeat protein
VWTLVETETIVGEPGAYRLVHDLPTIQVPATVQAVLAARIDRLPLEEKRLLQTAAVIGTEVPMPLLQAIAEMPEETLHRSLTHLQAAESLYETNLFPERVYTFKHALTHEVAYGSLLQERRRTLHARIVEALEALGGDWVADQVERLAHHAFQGEAWDKALIYFRQAGAKAMARSSYREAVACFDQAQSALERLPESRDTLDQAIDLRIELRGALYPLGEYERVFDLMREAETLAESLGDHRRLGRVYGILSNYWFVRMGRHDKAIAFCQRALALTRTSGDFVLQVSPNYLLGNVYYILGDYRQAMEVLTWNVVFLDGDTSRKFLGMVGNHAVFSRVYLALCLTELGSFAEGITRCDEAVRLTEADGRPANLYRAYFGVGYLHLRQGNFQQAISILERGLILCQDGNDPLWFPWIASAMGAAHVLSGRIPEALSLLEQAVEQVVSRRLIGMQWFPTASLSEAYLLAGRRNEATPLAQRALTHSREYKERGHEAYALRLLGEIHARRDSPDVDQAETHYHQALTLANELGMRPLQAHCHRGLGTLYSQTGHSEHARAELSTAIEMYRDMEMTFWIPETKAALAEEEGKS